MILELLTCEVCIFVTNWVNFYRTRLFLYVCKQTSRISQVRISQRMTGVKVRNLQYTISYVKKEILQILMGHHCTFDESEEKYPKKLNFEK